MVDNRNGEILLEQINVSVGSTLLLNCKKGTSYERTKRVDSFILNFYLAFFKMNKGRIFVTTKILLPAISLCKKLISVK